MTNESPPTLRGQEPKHLAAALHHLTQASGELTQALRHQAGASETADPQHAWLTTAIDDVAAVLDRVRRVTRHAPRE